MPDPTLLAIGAAILAIIGIVALMVRGRGTNTETETAPPPPPPEYDVTLYSGGEVVKTFVASRFSTGDGKAYAVAPGDTEYTILSGTYVIEPKGSPRNSARAPDSKYKVSLFSGDKAVREWYTPRMSTGNWRIYIYQNDAADYTLIGGTFLVEPLT